MVEPSQSRICIPICAQSVSELVAAIERAARVGDLIELRLDCLTDDELEAFQHKLPTLLPTLTRPVILTLRPHNQGGWREINRQSRINFWTRFFAQTQTPSLFADIELDLALLFLEHERQGQSVLDWQRVICSHHDFAGGADEASAIYEQMSKTPARVLKIAVQADEITDCLPVFHLLDRARREGREMIAVAMGDAGLMTRILAPARGTFLTYGTLDEKQKTAPGQVSAQRLRELYRIDRLDRQTMVMGLIGSPVMHSFSPLIHNSGFKVSGLNAVFIPFEVRQVDSFVRRMAHPRTCEMDWNLRGLSVTAPHKTAVMAHLDFVEPSAREIGAVNTVVVEGEELRGFNTDVIGFISTLSAKLGALRGLRCAVLGAGGAARAVLWGLQQEGAQSVVFARDAKKAAPLAESFGATSAPLAQARFDEFDAVINATPLGTRGPLESETVVVASQLRGARLAYDLVYNPFETRFMREAQAAGCETMGGLGMLVAQAAEQFQLWTGMTAPLELMREVAASALK